MKLFYIILICLILTSCRLEPEIQEDSITVYILDENILKTIEDYEENGFEFISSRASKYATGNYLTFKKVKENSNR